MIPRIRQVQIRNYKSIAQAAVALEPFTVLVGPNGAGKSNFIDALAFVKDCLSESIEFAFKQRGGIRAVRRRSAGHPTNIGIRLILDLNDNLSADYAFQIAARPTGRFSVARERCVLRRLLSEGAVFDVRHGEFSREIPGIRPKVTADRLALFAASATEEFRPVYDFLTSMRFYSIVPERLQELQDPDPGDSLKRDGSNAAAVLRHLQEDPSARQHYYRLCRLLGKVAKGIELVRYMPAGPKETLHFVQRLGRAAPLTFDASSMSEGTVRVLGLLLAAYQGGRHSIIAIEEPEATVHPGAAEVVFEVLMDAANDRQILLTTHSPDILDQKDLKDAQIRAVTIDEDGTSICPLAESSRQAVRERLYTPGELLRSDELKPNVAEAEAAARQLVLFGPPVQMDEEPT